MKALFNSRYRRRHGNLGSGRRNANERVPVERQSEPQAAASLVSTLVESRSAPNGQSFLIAQRAKYERRILRGRGLANFKLFANFDEITQKVEHVVYGDVVGTAIHRLTTSSGSDTALHGYGSWGGEWVLLSNSRHAFALRRESNRRPVWRVIVCMRVQTGVSPIRTSQNK